MVDVRLTIRSVLIQCPHHLLIQSDYHDVRANVEFITASHRMGCVGHPFTAVHIRYSDALHVGRATSNTVLDELEEDPVKAAGFIMGASRKPRKTGPSIGASPENPELASGRIWPVKHGCILRNTLWTRTQRGCDF